MASPCTNDPSEVIEKVVSAEVNADKFDAFVNGTDTQTVQLGEGAATPTIRNTVRQMMSAASELPNADVSGKSSTANGGLTMRSLAERFADIINVKDFGAKGDGINDDYSVIQTALTTLGGSGKTLFFPSGTYRLTASLGIPSKLRLLGEPGSVLKRDFATGSTGSRVIGSLVPLTNETKIYDVEIIDIVFDGNGPSYPDTSFDIFVIANYPAYNITFDKCTFKNVVDLHALDISYASSVDILNCRFIGFSNPHSNDNWFSNKREAIQFDLGSIDDSFRNNKIRIENCYFGHSDEFGSWTAGIGNHGYLDTSEQCEDIIIKNNIFDGVEYCAITCMGLKNVVIDGNIIYTNGDGIHCISRIDSETPAKAICENVFIVNNIIENVNSTTLHGNGVRIWCSSGNNIADPTGCFNKNIVVSDNKFSFNATGIRVECSDGLTVSNNVFNVESVYSGHFLNTKIENNFCYASGSGMYLAVGMHSIDAAVNNEEFNKNLAVSKNKFINPTARCIHVSGNGKKDIVVEDNVVFDSTGSSTASSIELAYIQVDSTRKNCVIKNNVVFADYNRGVSYAFYCSKTNDVAFNNRYIVSGSTKYPYDVASFPEAYLSYIPSSDNSLSLGVSANRWSTVYAGTGSINTSDAREKTDIEHVSNSLAKAWGKVRISTFKFNDSVEKKGGDARIHIGVVAQQVLAAFQSEGLDASKYGLFCYDEWEDEFEELEDGTKIKTQSAGNRYGIRYDEALALECAYQRWLGEKRDTRIAELEVRLNEISGNGPAPSGASPDNL